MYPILFQWGPLSLYSYGCMIACGVCLSLFLIRKNILHTALAPQLLMDCVLLMLLSGIIGARLWYIATHFSEFENDIFSAIKLWEGGLVYYGGMIFAAVTLGLICRIKKISFFACADCLVPFLSITQAFGRIGCFLNGCCYGKTCWNALGVHYPFMDVPVYPVQLFEAVFCLILAIFLIILYRRKHFSGETMLSYFIFYPVGRFFVEYFRGDQPMFILGLTQPQLLSIIFIGIATFLYCIRKRFHYDTPSL